MRRHRTRLESAGLCTDERKLPGRSLGRSLSLLPRACCNTQAADFRVAQRPIATNRNLRRWRVPLKPQCNRFLPFMGNSLGPMPRADTQ